MPSSAKKRKASDLEHETDYDNSERAKRRGSSKRASTASIDEIPFRASCPVTGATKYKSDDVFVENREIVPGYAFDYAVEPGSRWRAMKSYRHARYSEHTFTIGDIVYINNKSPPPESPPPNASDADLLAYDRENFWVARIAETRAESDRTAVYLRVFWLYWPEELPMGRQLYHAEQELIMSNAMDVLDAQTIASAADVTHWDENDIESRVGERFWRQTFDVGKLGRDRKGGLSALKRHCVCQQPYNPDTTLYQCKKLDCQTWNHEACLLSDIQQRSWDAYEKGALDDLDVQHVKAENDDKETLLTTLGRYVQDKMKPAVEAVIDQAVVHETKGFADSPTTTDSHVSKKKKKRPNKSEPGDKFKPATSAGLTPWEGILRVYIIEPGDKADELVLARIEEVTGGKSTKKGKKKSTAASGKKWTIPVQCLVCRNVME